MARSGMVSGLKSSADEFLAAKQHVCEPCVLARQQRRPFFASQAHAEQPLDCIHSDVFGPVTPPDRDGNLYGITFTDDHTTLSVVRLMKTKGEAARHTLDVFNLLETQLDRKIKTLRTDNGREYLSKVFLRDLAARGIIH